MCEGEAPPEGRECGTGVCARACVYYLKPAARTFAHGTARLLMARAVRPEAGGLVSSCSYRNPLRAGGIASIYQIRRLRLRKVKTDTQKIK